MQNPACPPFPVACPCELNSAFTLDAWFFNNGTRACCTTMDSGTISGTYFLNKLIGLCVWESSAFGACNATLKWRLTCRALNDWTVELLEGASVRATWVNSGTPGELDGFCTWIPPSGEFAYSTGNDWCDWIGTVLVSASP